MRRQGHTNRRVSSLGLPDASGPIALWLANNKVPLTEQAIGYTAAQIARSGYAGPAAVSILIDGGVAHDILPLSDGGIAISTSEDSGGNENESFFYVPPDALTERGAVDLRGDPRVLRFRSGDFTNTTATGARTIVQLADDSMLLGIRGAAVAHLTWEQFTGADPDWEDAPVTHISRGDGNTAAGQMDMWAAAVDADGNYWHACNNGVARYSATDILSGAGAGSPIVPDKIFGGSNTSTAPANTGVYGTALDDDGGLWLVNLSNSGSFSANAIKYYDAAALAALTGSITNLAPTRVLSSSSFNVNTDDVAFIALDRVNGGAWVVHITSRKLEYFTAAQIAAGGSQAPSKTIWIPPNYINYNNFTGILGVRLT